ncbi:MAG: hypothetical protein HY726_08470 [Candidatus Rokubacteria bacterium]|nr:hypothetical protein [Candidatus Rokubacteria bacterium]
MCGLAAADHAEYHPDAALALIVAAACPVGESGTDGSSLGGAMKIGVSRASRTYGIYGVEQIEERFNCSYELNPAFEGALEAAGLSVVGRGEQGQVRIVELSNHRFFVATLFQPQLSSAPGASHPLILAFLRASRALPGARRTSAA